MIDAYCHLDSENPSPLADLDQKLASAGLAGAFLIETWDGRNRTVLNHVLRGERGQQFLVALCYRENFKRELLRIAQTGRIAGIRMSTENLRGDPCFCGEMASLGLTLVVHAETGIASLCRELLRVQRTRSHPAVYIPHLAWPLPKGTLGTDWAHAVKELASVEATVFGVSAITHFSSEPFPHNDVRDLALMLISQVPPARIVIGSDYPLCARDRYADYIDLACQWVRSVHPSWATSGFPVSLPSQFRSTNSQSGAEHN